MAKIENLTRLTTALRSRIVQARQNAVSVSVGFTAAYSLFVHENLQAQHKVGGAKFLEAPARELRGELAQIVFKALKARKTMAQALLLAGLRLQRESQQRAPVLTGNLKASAFTRLNS